MVATRGELAREGSAVTAFLQYGNRVVPEDVNRACNIRLQAPIVGIRCAWPPKRVHYVERACVQPRGGEALSNVVGSKFVKWFE